MKSKFANNRPTTIKLVISDDDLQHVRETYCNTAKAGDRLIMRLMARLEASEECLKDYFEAGTIHPLLEQFWKKTAGKVS